MPGDCYYAFGYGTLAELVGSLPSTGILQMTPDRLIGLAMRAYRKSPFYPRFGKPLAKLLSFIASRQSAQVVHQKVNGICFELDVSEVIDASLYYSGTFEADAEKIISRFVGPGSVSVDIGANFGYHTFAMARLAGASGRVIALEPTEWAFAKLQRNASANDFKNITFLRLGLGDEDIGGIDTSFRSSYRLDGTQRNIQERIVIRTLDAVLDEQGVSSVDFIKLDVDGFEGKVLRGARRTLERFHPVIFFEISPSLMQLHGDIAEDLIRSLYDRGYRFLSEAGDPITDISGRLATIADGMSENLVALCR